MGRSVPSEVLCRQAALACYRNAESLHEEAKLLEEHDHSARAVALALIGLEEFAKAIVYTLAALLPHDRQILVEKFSELHVHEVKHMIATIAEVTQIACADGIAVAEQDAGYSMSAEEYLATLLAEMARQGLARMIGTTPDAKKAYKQSSASDPDSASPKPPGPKYLVEIDRKNAALYVDLTREGELLTPDRAARYAVGEILGTGWFFTQYGALPYVLEDDAKWKKFATSFTP